MPSAGYAQLADRGAVSVSGPDAAKFLQGLLTNDVDIARRDGAMFGALLSPQGKILFDLFVVARDDAFLIDCARVKAGELAKRLAMYKLRADVAIADVSDRAFVYVAGPDAARLGGAVVDPRSAALGFRLVSAEPASGAIVDSEAYDLRRISAAAPESGKDYAFGDAVPHEANFDLLNGVSFTKGCYVGQEVVARMQNKSVVRKRVVRVTGGADLASGAEILLGEAPIGRVGTTDGASALAMLRLDRAIEALDAGRTLTADGVAVEADQSALDRYRVAASARANAIGTTL